MQKRARDYLDELNRRHRKNRKALVAWILLAVLVVGSVMGTLAQYGVAMGDETTCGIKEHAHGDMCYDGDSEDPNCGFKEHRHTSECYSKSEGAAAEQPGKENGGDSSKPDGANPGNAESMPASPSSAESSGGESKLGETPSQVTTPGSGEGSDTETSEPTKGQKESDPAEPTKGPEESGPTEPTKGPEESDPTEPTKGPEESDPTEPTKGPGESNPEEPSAEPMTESAELEETTQASGQESEDIQPDTTGYITEEEARKLLDEQEEESALSLAWLSAPAAQPRRAPARSRAAQNTNTWTFDAQYVSRQNSADQGVADPFHDTVKTDNFNLKYQMSFHTDETIAAGAVEIRIPRKLLDKYDKNGQKMEGDNAAVTPDDIAVDIVPGKNETGGLTTSFPFCYYIDTDKDELVFFNHKEIAANASLVWQVLYKNVRLMNLQDGDTWTLQPVVTVTKNTEEGETEQEPETQECTPLTGRIDSSVSVDNVSITSYKASGSSYTPGLYTENQVKQYISAENLPDDFKGEKFNDYKYVVWDVQVSGKATQPWKLQVIEMPKVNGAEGKVVGYQKNSTVTRWDLSVSHDDKTGADCLMADGNTTENWSCRFYVVTAYPKEGIVDDTLLENNIRVLAKPVYYYNEKNETSETIPGKDAYAAWRYTDYKWYYGERGLSAVKKNYASETKGGDGQYRQTYSGWLDAYNYNAGQGKDYGGLPYYVRSYLPGYDMTHTVVKKDENGNDVQSGDGTSGNYISGAKYGLVTTDDLLYAYADDIKDPNADKSRKLLDHRDYYYTGVTITQTDTGYNVWEDKAVMPADVPEYELIPDNYRGMPVKIYAMFAHPDGNGGYNPSTEWELVDDTIMMNDKTGTATYEFNEETLVKQPWRVKVVHETVHYATSCEISLELCIRHNSPKMWGADGILTGQEDQNQENYGLMEQDGGFTSGSSYSIGLWGLAGAYGTYTHDGKTELYSMGEGTNASMGTDHTDAVGALLGIYGDEFEIENKVNELTVAKEPAVNSDNLGETLYFMAAYKTLSSYGKDAGASKQSKTYVDPSTSERMLVEYCLTAYDGYEVTRKEDQEYLPQAGVPSPGRKKVEFYDLLPLGMTLDPSYKLKAGRITSLSGTEYQKRPELWEISDQTKVSYKIISTDHNNTGRTLVCFTVEYSGAESAEYMNNRWASAWGVNFRAYYNKKDMELVSDRDNENISAFMSGDPEHMELYGKDNQVARDNGELADGAIAYGGKLGVDFSGKGLDKDDDLKNKGVILYANATVNDDVAQRGELKLEKKVRANAAGSYGTYADYAVVQPGGGYTYNVTVGGDGKNNLTDVVVFDILEQANPADETVKTWKGTFQSVNTIGLGLLGIDPVVYYKTGVINELPAVATEKKEVEAIVGYLNDESNGWFKSTAYTGRKEDVTAIAVYFKAPGENGGSYDFITETGSLMSASFQINMQAPDENTLQEKYGIILGGEQEPIALAVNKPYYHALWGNEIIEGYGEPTEVKVSKQGILRIAKEFVINEEEPAPPVSVRNTVFKFSVKEPDGTTAFGGRTYTLYEKGEDGKYSPVGSGATSLSGELSLKAGQMADFGLVSDARHIHVEEVKNIFWEESRDQVKSGGMDSVAVGETTEEYPVWSHTITNKFRPPLYFRKKVEGIPDSLDETEKNAVENSFFTFKIQIKSTKEGSGWEPLANSDFWYVKSARTDGGLPEQDKSRVQTGTGKTDAYGQFTLKAGETIALFPGAAGVQYRIEEVSSKVNENGDADPMVSRENGKNGKANGRWLCVSPVAESGEKGLPAAGATEAVTNCYRWKDLYVAKNITHQDKADYDGTQFTFELRKIGADGRPAAAWTDSGVAGHPVTWTLLNEDGTPAVNGDGNVIGGSLTNGEFTCACGWRTVRITGLEADAAYQVREIENANDLYEGKTAPAKVVMPTAASESRLTFTNDYLMRPLSVSKTVLIDPQADAQAKQIAEATPFAMTVKVGEDKDNLKLLTDCQYTILNSDGSVATSYYTGLTDAGEPSGIVSAVNGVFEIDGGKIWLRHGQTAVMKYAGELDWWFEVREEQVDAYAQLYPDKDENGTPLPHTKQFTNDKTDAEISFVNGQNDGTVLYISKEYVTASEDATIKAMEEKWIHPNQWTPSMVNTGNGKVKLQLQITDKNGNTKDYMGRVTMINKVYPMSYDSVWGSDDPENPNIFELDANYIVMIAGLDSECSYTLTEVEESQNRLVYDQNQKSYFEISQKIPEKGGSVRGTTKANPRAVITNQVKYVSTGAVILKSMTDGSSEVPVGAKLVWQLQKYDEASGWIPAGDEEYVTFDKNGITCSKVETTLDDGKIVLYKTENGFPGAGFPGLSPKQVKLNAYTEADQQLVEVDGKQLVPYRVVEIPEESAVEWGLLAGYFNIDKMLEELVNMKRSASRGADDAEGLAPTESSYYQNPLDYLRKKNDKGDIIYSLDKKNACVFVNSNVTTPVIVEKEMEIAPEDPTALFTMTLKQVVSYGLKEDGTPNPDTYVTEPREGITYKLYTGDTFVESATKENGEILLQAGQYAELELPENTLWTVSENMASIYDLKSMKKENVAEGSQILRELGKNLMQIDLAKDDQEKTYIVTYDYGCGFGTESVSAAPYREIEYPYDYGTESPGTKLFGVCGWVSSPEQMDEINVSGKVDSDMYLYAVRSYYLSYQERPVNGVLYSVKYSVGETVTFTVQDGPKNKDGSKEFVGWKDPKTQRVYSPGETIEIGYKDSYQGRSGSDTLGIQLEPIWEDKVKYEVTVTGVPITESGKYDIPSQSYELDYFYGKPGDTVDGDELNTLHPEWSSMFVGPRYREYLKSEPRSIVLGDDGDVKKIELIYGYCVHRTDEDPLCDSCRNAYFDYYSLND